MKLVAVSTAAFLFAALGSLLTAPFAAGQERPRTYRPPPAPSPCSVTVEDGSGRSLPTYTHGGRTYLLGERGARYSIRVNNRSSGRVEAVISVDGRNAITGRVGDYRRQRGYVLPAYGSVTVDGFRQSLDAVASFRFSTPGQSYSSRLGTPENVGVLGVACFVERPRPVAVVPYPTPRYDLGERSARREAPSRTRGGRSTDDAAPEAKSRPRSARPGTAPGPQESTGNLGTEYGESRYSPVSTTTFERAEGSHPRQLVTLYYDDLAGLEARGIRVRPAPEPIRWSPSPEPFPESRFAPPPP